MPDAAYDLIITIKSLLFVFRSLDDARGLLSPAILYALIRHRHNLQVAGGQIIILAGLLSYWSWVLWKSKSDVRNMHASLHSLNSKIIAKEKSN